MVNGCADFATTTSVLVLAFSFSFSEEESALPMTHQLPCFLGIGRSVTAGATVLDFGLGELPVHGAYKYE